jgi:hypothetical protein
VSARCETGMARDEYTLGEGRFPGKRVRVILDVSISLMTCAGGFRYGKSFKRGRKGRAWGPSYYTEEVCYL